MREVTLLELLKSGVHFGHQKSRWHPKMKPYIYTERSGIHIIDLEQTHQKLQEALKFVQEIAKKGGSIVFIGTKKQSQNIIKKYAESCGMPYIINRWIGGLFTNFSVVKKLIDKLADLKNKDASGELKKYTKKEIVSFRKKINKLESLVGGISGLKKIPDAIFVVDQKEEKTAVSEAIRKNIPIISMSDSNNDPSKITYPIPANNDATKSINLITSLIAESILEGKNSTKQEAEVKDKPSP